MNDLIEAALDYATRGWHVFPLAPHSKRPAIPSHTAGECDRTDPYCAEGHLGWEERSTTDPDEIHALWAAGRYGIAIATGPSRLLVLDIDVSKLDGGRLGLQSLAHLEARCGRRVPERTFTVATPSGGQHRYFQMPPDTAHLPTTTTGRLGPGLDTRGRGGYIVAPPTTLTPDCRLSGRVPGTPGAGTAMACRSAHRTYPFDELAQARPVGGRVCCPSRRPVCAGRHRWRD